MIVVLVGFDDVVRGFRITFSFERLSVAGVDMPQLVDKVAVAEKSDAHSSQDDDDNQRKPDSIELCSRPSGQSDSHDNKRTDNLHVTHLLSYTEHGVQLAVLYH